MRIRRITLENNIVFGTGIVEFDFTKPDWSVYDNILLVGENGSWKSTLLDIIFEFSQFTLIPIKSNAEKKEIEVEFSDAELLFIKNIPQFIECTKYFVFSFDYSTTNWSQIIVYNNWKTYPASDLAQEPIRGIFKSIYSTTEINFSWESPKTITNKDTDQKISESQKSSSNLSIEITQLLLDIRQKDNEDESYHRDVNNVPIPEPERQLRTKRFKNAFDKVFAEGLVYEWVKDMKPIFKKWWSNFDITKLSSWEKQIVFRWWYLLKDQKSLKWSPVLIDEPEISLHPSRQLKIINFYRDLFKDTETNQQTSQIFFTTHSPYVLKSYNPNDFQIYVFQRDDTTSNVTVTGSINLWGMYGTPTWWEINRYAYLLPTIEFHDELYGYLQTKYNSFREESIEEYFRQQSIVKTKKRTREVKWKPDPDFTNYDITLQTFIRNRSHHPENITMQPHDFTINELKQSIEEMLSLI